MGQRVGLPDSFLSPPPPPPLPLPAKEAATVPASVLQGNVRRGAWCAVLREQHNSGPLFPLHSRPFPALLHIPLPHFFLPFPVPCVCLIAPCHVIYSHDKYPCVMPQAVRLGAELGQGSSCFVITTKPLTHDHSPPRQHE